MEDFGAPTSYLELEDGTPVYSSDGEEIGSVDHVLADENIDIFDGLIIDTGAGHRFADASLVDHLYQRAAVLTLDAAACAELPEPAENPAVMDAGPDDVEPDTLQDRLKRAWDWISGRY